MVYESLSLLAGAMVALMVTANSLLSASVGLWMGTLIIHICGLAAVCAVLAIRRRPVTLRAPRARWYMYLGGVGGVLTTALNSLCFGPLGAVLMLAMTIVGQLLGACLVDHFGWLGMERHPFRARKLLGFAAMAVGLSLMTLSGPADALSANSVSPMPRAVYALLALATGVNLSFTTTVNASLSGRIGVSSSTLLNYLTGLAASAACVAVLGGWRAPGADLGLFPLAGGALGAGTVALASTVLPRISVTHSTILMFVGQITAGMAVDAANGLPVTPPRIAGCAIIAAGLIYNVYLDKRLTANGAPHTTKEGEAG